MFFVGRKFRGMRVKKHWQQKYWKKNLEIIFLSFFLVVSTSSVWRIEASCFGQPTEKKKKILFEKRKTFDCNLQGRSLKKEKREGAESFDEIGSCYSANCEILFSPFFGYLLSHSKHIFQFNLASKIPKIYFFLLLVILHQSNLC